MKTIKQKVYNLLSLIHPSIPNVNEATADEIDMWYQEDIKTLTNKIKELEEQLDKATFSAQANIPVSDIELWHGTDNTFFDINHYNHLKKTNEEQSLLYLYEMGNKSKHNPYLFYKLTKNLHIPTMNNDELVYLANSLSGSVIKHSSNFIEKLNLIKYAMIKNNGDEKALELWCYHPDLDIDVELTKMGLNTIN